MGTKLQELRSGCFAKAMDDEPMFVLLARDQRAPDLIRDWCSQREAEVRAGARPASDMDQINEARQCATNMEQWRRENDGAWREGLFARGEQLKVEVARGLDDAGMSPEDAEADEEQTRMEDEARYGAYGQG